MDSEDLSCPKHSVVVFDRATGKQVKVIGKDAHMGTPRVVAVDTKGFIYVADSRNNRILKFDMNKKEPVCTFRGETKNDDMILDYLFGMCIIKEEIYVADKENDCIRVLNLNLEEQCSFGGKKDESKRNIRKPTGIVFDSEEKHFYVASEGSAVNKFDENFSHIKKIVKVDEEIPLPLDKLRGIAISSNGKHIFVTEPCTNYVLCFTTYNEKCVKKAKTWNGRPFKYPQVVALDPEDNYLYVGDETEQLHCIELDKFLNGE